VIDLVSKIWRDKRVQKDVRETADVMKMKKNSFTLQLKDFWLQLPLMPFPQQRATPQIAVKSE
jgi:hypothetical protein